MLCDAILFQRIDLSPPTYWGSEDGSPPIAVPVCGFRGQFCPDVYDSKLKCVSLSVYCFLIHNCGIQCYLTMLCYSIGVSPICANKSIYHYYYNVILFLYSLENPAIIGGTLSFVFIIVCVLMFIYWRLVENESGIGCLAAR